MDQCQSDILRWDNARAERKAKADAEAREVIRAEEASKISDRLHWQAAAEAAQAAADDRQIRAEIQKKARAAADEAKAAAANGRAMTLSEAARAAAAAEPRERTVPLVEARVGWYRAFRAGLEAAAENLEQAGKPNALDMAFRAGWEAAIARGNLLRNDDPGVPRISREKMLQMWILKGRTDPLV